MADPDLVEKLDRLLIGLAVLAVVVGGAAAIILQRVMR